MELIYKLNESEFTTEFVNSIKKQFKGKELEVTVNVKEDETEYLLKSEANRSQLLKAVKDVKSRKNLQVLDMKKLKEMVK